MTKGEKTVDLHTEVPVACFFSLTWNTRHNVALILGIYLKCPSRKDG